MLVGIHCNVSHLEIRFMMKHLALFKKYKKYDDPSTPCKCRIMKAIGLPCHHMLGRYKTPVPLDDIDPYWKQLSFKPAPREDIGEEFGDMELGRIILEKYPKLNRLDKQTMKHKLMPIVYPFMEELQEPAKQDPTGRPPTTKTREEEREQIKEYLSTKCDQSKRDQIKEYLSTKCDQSEMDQIKEYLSTKCDQSKREQIKEHLSTKCDPSGHVYSEAQYKEEPSKKKRGHPRKETTTPTVSNLNPNSIPLLESQASVEYVGKKRGRPRKDSTTTTISNLNPNGTLPLESQASQGDVAKKRGRPRKVV
ncbi:uncharacterized protein LOC113314709 [Papaver somniferum]|uniref:uncharacterized protein LOC113314709 n=1 Tax=Papaver somniferum TaxID=3469 RepID=UPI000E6F938C|nr:uncharacterized protein LOC113314709 [Papaver somniferum]